MNDNLNALPLGSELNHYVIEAVLGSGGFGIVYKAHHAHLDEQVVIKEFLPVELAGRHGNTVAPHGTSKQEVYSECLRRFMEEGRTLVKLRHPNVVRCRDLFTANGTAYLVMDFEDGLPLDELVRSLEAQGSRYTEQQLLHFLLPLADGLAYIHSQGVLHRDIKPANVFIRRSDGSPVIIDFGAAKQNFALASQSQAPFTEFYAPLEQIEGGGEAKPTVDIHAFGGLMYRLATGQMGPKAEARAMALVYGKPDTLKPAADLAKGHYSESFLKTIDQCLAFKASERPQTIAEVAKRLAWQDKAQKDDGSQFEAGLSALDDLIALAGVDDVITDTEMNMLLNKAASFGISKDPAQRYIVQQAVANGWSIGQPENKAKMPEASEDIAARIIKQSGVDEKQYADKLRGNVAKGSSSRWKWAFAMVAAVVLVIGFNTYKQYEAAAEAARVAALTQQQAQLALEALVTQEDDKADLIPLNLDIKPAGQYVVRVLNIKPKFTQGMLVAPGEYDIEISKGKEKIELIVSLVNGDAVEIDFYQFLAEQAIDSEEEKTVTLESDKARTLRLKAEQLYWNKSDYNNAANLLIQASALGSVYADAQLARLYFVGLGVETNEAKGKAMAADVKAKLENSNDDKGLAHYLLGRLAYSMESDYNQAIKHYKKSAEFDYAYSMLELGHMYRQGSGVAKSQSDAFKWYKKAAERDLPEAQYYMGIITERGEGVAKSDREAVTWYKKAAQLGHLSAQVELAEAYEYGEGIAQSDKDAFGWYYKAAEQGDAHSQVKVGFRYHKGIGTAQSYEEAVKWFRKAADQDNANAQFNLGHAYYNGNGVERSITESMHWVLKAKEQGSKQAEYALINWTWN